MFQRMIAQTGFNEDIKPLFTDIDIAHMNKFFDLSNWLDTRKNASIILARVKAKTMPPGGWSDDKINLFEVWTNDNCPKYKGQKYADFFIDLDAHTEYCDLYNVSPDCTYMNAVGVYWKILRDNWFTYAQYGSEPEGQEALETLKQSLQDEKIKNSLTLTDQLLKTLIEKHFVKDDQTVDIEAYFDAIERFALDIYPEDLDRFNRVPDGDGRKDHAKYHRMDGETMWFVWAGQNEWTSLIDNNTDVYSPTRKLQFAGAIYGCCLDYTFRDERSANAKKIPATKNYRKDDRTLNLLRKRAIGWFNDFNSAVSECHQLYQIYSN